MAKKHGLAAAVYNAQGQTLTDGDSTGLFVNSYGYLQTQLANVNGTPSGNLGVSSDHLVILDMADGSTLNSNVWSTSTSTMTITQSAGLITLNAGASTTGGAYAILTSVKNVQFAGGLTIAGGFTASITNAGIANTTVEFGFGKAATTSAPTDGVFFRYASDGTFKAVVSTGGVETVSSALQPPTSAALATYAIIVSQTNVVFLVGTTGSTAIPLAVIPTPTTVQSPTSASRQPMFARVYNGGSAPASAPQLAIGGLGANEFDIDTGKSWGDTSVGLGRGAYQDAAAFTQTANHANSTDPSSATLSNTAAGYTTLGGRYQFVAPATAATDFALFAYQVPAGFQLYVTGVTISAMNTGAAVATTATVLDWSLGVNSSAVSLATTNSATTWAPRRLPLGMQSFLVSAGIGTAANDIVRTFPTSVVVDSLRYLHVIVEVPVGTATASQVIRGDVLINGYFE